MAERIRALAKLEYQKTRCNRRANVALATLGNLAVSGANTCRLLHEQGLDSALMAALKVDDTREAAAKALCQYYHVYLKNLRSADELKLPTLTEILNPPGTPQLTPCTCGVFLSGQFNRTSPVQGNPVLMNEHDEHFTCNRVGDKQCINKCLDVPSYHLRCHGQGLQQGKSKLDRDFRLLLRYGSPSLRIAGGGLPRCVDRSSPHNATGTNLGLALTWNRAQQVFLFMKPRLLPAYDSTGKCVVTPDHESLYLKLLECVPPELNASQDRQVLHVGFMHQPRSSRFMGLSGIGSRQPIGYDVEFVVKLLEPFEKKQAGNGKFRICCHRFVDSRYLKKQVQTLPKSLGPALSLKAAGLARDNFGYHANACNGNLLYFLPDDLLVNESSSTILTSVVSSSEQDSMIDKCLAALETCHKRFSEHYKTLYNLAHFYFKSKKRKSVEKVQQLLLGPNGLFGDRKPYNFFNESTHTLDSAIRFCAGEIAIQKQVPYSGGSSGSLPPFPTSLPSQIHPTSRILDNVSITPIEVRWKTLPEGDMGSVSVSCGSGNVSLGQDNSSPAAVLKERPSLSIIPVTVSSGSPAASAGPKSPSTSSQSALLSINKLASKAAKRSQSPLALSMGVTSISGMSPTSIMAKGIQAIAGSTSLLTSTASALSMLPSSVQMHPIPGAAMPNPLQHLTITPTSSRANIPATTAGSSPLNQVLQPYSIAPAVPPSTSSFSSLTQPVPVSSVPSLMTPSVPVTTSSSLHPHPLSLTPTSQVPTSLPLPLTTHSSNRQVATSLAQLIQPPSSGSISISPIPAPLSAPSPLIAAAHQPSKKSSASHKSPGQPKQRLPELPKPAHTSSEYSKSRFGGSLIHSLQSSIPPQQSSNQPTLSLQHKLLAKKLNQSKIKQDSSLTQPLPSSSVGGSANPHAYSTDSKSFLSHPTPKSQSQLPSAVSGPVPKATPAFGSSPTTPMALTNPPKLPSNVMKKLPNSLTIVPSGSASRGPDPLSDMVTSASSAAPKKSFFDEIFDQNVTNAIKSFGSSITITAAKTHKLPYSTSESVPAPSASHSSATTEPAPKSRKMPKKKKLSNEVIVLDD
ncbi:unnamed protein product [Nesidiocoris tenuis]|uniref:Uncharacterized protein n=1 Tax=Nesidiocoris tenuis TaxID=355587 RepID=A0A6H5G187_9HEMI|nr:unnamed protein product [Nesidiocoris tenuis]